MKGTGMIERLLRAVDEGHGHVDRVRARFTLLAVLILAAFGAVRMVQNLAFGQHPQALLIGVATLIALTLPWVLVRTRSIALVGHVLMSLVFVVLARAAYMTGGAASPALVALAIVPIGAAFMTGKRGGVAWTLVSALAITAFAALARLGVRLPSIPSSAVIAMTATGAFGVLVVMLLFALAYERARATVSSALTERTVALDDTLRALGAREHERAELSRRHRRWAELLSHEANNALTSVMADIDFAEAAASDPTLKEALSEAHVGAERLRSILQDMIELHGVGAQPCVRALDARDLVRDVMRRAELDLARVGVRARCTYDRGAVVARVDASALEVTLRGLLSGLAPEATLSVEVTSRPPRVRVEGTGPRPRELGVEAAERRLAASGATVRVAWSASSWCATIELAPGELGLDEQVA